MARQTTQTNNFPAATYSLRSVSPKTVTAVVLMLLMGVLWLRVLTGGQTGPSAAQAAEQAAQEQAARLDAQPLRIEAVALPVIEGRHDTLAGDVFTPTNWPQLRPAEDSTPEPVDDGTARRRQQQEAFEAMIRTLHLDAILHAAGGASAQACINDKVLSQGQTLRVKTNSQTYDLTVSEVGENQVVLTWQQWSAVLNIAESEHVD